MRHYGGDRTEVTAPARKSVQYAGRWQSIARAWELGKPTQKPHQRPVKLPLPPGRGSERGGPEGRSALGWRRGRWRSSWRRGHREGV